MTSRTFRPSQWRSTVTPMSTRSKVRMRLPAFRAFTSGCWATARARLAMTNPVHDTRWSAAAIRALGSETSSSTSACTWNRRLALASRSSTGRRFFGTGERTYPGSASSGPRRVRATSSPPPEIRDPRHEPACRGGDQRMPLHSSRSHGRGSSTTAETRVEPHRGPAAEVVPRPARVAAGGEGDPGGVHRRRRVPAAGSVPSSGPNSGASGAQVVEDERDLERVAPRRGPARARRTRTCRCRRGRRRRMRLGEADGREPHPPVGLHRREQVARAWPSGYRAR